MPSHSAPILPPGTLVLASPAQREAVASPIRLEILEHLRQAGSRGASVRDLARQTGRPSTALHYHVNLLHSAGLLEVAGTRPPPAGGKRPERVYRPAAEHFALAARRDDRAALESGSRAAAATMRLAQREIARALTRAPGAAGICQAGAGRNFFMRRFRAALSPDALAEVNSLIDRIERVFRDEIRRRAKSGGAIARENGSTAVSGPGSSTLCSMTLALAPTGPSAQSKGA